MNKPIVSVIVPIYNISKYLEKCVKSICEQSYSSLEVILVDDGSSDVSRKIVDNMALMDMRIKKIHKKNGGLVSARKAGLEVATGKYCVHVDGDDWIEPDYIEKLVRTIEEIDAELVQASYLIEGETTKEKIFPECGINLENVEVRENILERWMFGYSIIDNQIWTKIYKTDFAKEFYKNVPDNQSYGEDIIFFLYAIKNAKKIASIEEPLYHYRVREDSMSHHIDGIQLLLKEDKLTNYLYDLIYSLFPTFERKIIDEWILQRKMTAYKYNLEKFGVDVIQYRYPDVDWLKNKKVVLYGAGSVGKDYLKYLSKYEDISIVAWVDRDSHKYNYEYRKVLDVKELTHLQFDYIIIAIKDIEIAHEVALEISENYNISYNKIIWDYSRDIRYIKS